MLGQSMTAASSLRIRIWRHRGLQGPRLDAMDWLHSGSDRPTSRTTRRKHGLSANHNSRTDWTEFAGSRPNLTREPACSKRRGRCGPDRQQPRRPSEGRAPSGPKCDSTKMDLVESQRMLAEYAGQPHSDGVEIHQPGNSNTPLPSLLGLPQQGD